MKITKEQAVQLLQILNDHLYGDDDWYNWCVNLDIIKYASQLEEERIATEHRYNPDKHGEPCDDYPGLADILEALGVELDIKLTAPEGYSKGWD